VSLFFIVLLFTTPLVCPVPSTTPASLPGLEPSHVLIHNVSYVSQETEFFCAYASMAMVFEFLGKNTTLNDVLYNAGIGYSLAHQQTSLFPLAGYILCQQPDNLNALASMYGLNVSLWYNETPDAWQQYLMYVKQNITNNTPVITSVNPIQLPSFRGQFSLPQDVWDASGSFGHAIVIIGFNESNNTVCYQDPFAEVLGDKSLGDYTWMTTTELRNVINTTVGTKQLIISFTNTSKPYNASEAFQKAQTRNRERLNGNSSVYEPEYATISGFSLGIKAVDSFQTQFTRGDNNRIKTVFFYEFFGRLTKQYNKDMLFVLLQNQIRPRTCLILFSTEHEFDRIALEKQYTAQYLLTKGDDAEASLFNKEAGLWENFSACYDVFLKKGFMLSIPRALFLTIKMNTLLSDIETVEQAIIDV